MHPIMRINASTLFAQPIVTRRSFIRKSGTFRRRSLKAPSVTVDRVVAGVQASLSLPEIADQDHITGQAERDEKGPNSPFNAECTDKVTTRECCDSEAKKVQMVPLTCSPVVHMLWAARRK